MQWVNTLNLKVATGDMSVGDQVPVPGVETMNDDGTAWRTLQAASGRTSEKKGVA